MNAFMSQIEILSWVKTSICQLRLRFHLKLRLEIVSCKKFVGGNFMWQTFFFFFSFHVTYFFFLGPFMMISQKKLSVFYLKNKAFCFWVFFAHQNACDKHDFLSQQDLKSNILMVKNILRCVTKIENLDAIETKGHLLKACLWHREHILCHILGVLEKGNCSFFERSNYQMAWSLWT
jgi:hypothetical protein